MAVLMRAVTYAAIFIAFVLVFLPAQVLVRAGTTPPASFGVPQAAGIAAVLVGGAVALWCVLAFALIGRGTPAPFDPPRRLVVRGPYRFVRNPMYVGAGVALAGAAGYYESTALLAFTAGFALATHLFVLLYEERALRTRFGADYEDYRRHVRRWLPRIAAYRPEREGKEAG
ncbi:MAG: isoprenylcysteine carboxylmethyltransferase family protein [Gemmatimonadota bacterium]|jgi:protein-S-isoprenylcysteine O-methyltransferase Ste14